MVFAIMSTKLEFKQGVSLLHQLVPQSYLPLYAHVCANSL